MKRQIIPILALFFALTGTGLAASRYVITSTAQIKPSVLRDLRASIAANGKAKLTRYVNRLVVHEGSPSVTLLEVPAVVRISAAVCGNEGPFTEARLTNLNPVSDIVPFGNNDGGHGEYRATWATAEEEEGGEIEPGSIRSLHEDWLISSGTGASSVVSRVTVTAGTSGAAGNRECAFSAVVNEYKGS